MPEKIGFRERAANKIVEVAIARQLKKVDRVQARIKTNLSKLRRGQLDSLAIAIDGILLPSGLEAETLELEIGGVTVNPSSAMRGKIQLIHPSEGRFRLVVNPESLTAALKTELLDRKERSRGDREAKIECLLSDGTIIFSIELVENNPEVPQRFVLAVTPEISPEGRALLLQQVRYLEGQEPSAEFTSAVLTRLHKLLSLQDFERKGMFLQIEQIEVSAGKLRLEAAAHIEQFPS